jgi:hypothetical protein
MNCLVAVWEPLSCTCTVKVAVAAELESVPASTPLELSASPEGAEPAVTDHVYPIPVPPAAASVVDGYVLPATPVGSVAVVISSAGLTAIVKCFVAVWLPPSCTSTVKVELAAEFESVPEITPPEVSARPAGSEPAVTDHVCPVPVPPLTVRVVDG